MNRMMVRNTVRLASFGDDLTAAVVGATGGIGGGLAEALRRCPQVGRVVRLSRRRPGDADASRPWLHLDLDDEDSILDAACALRGMAETVDLVIVASGVLHDGGRLQPEKSWRALSRSGLETAFRVNAIGPALVAKHFLPLLPRRGKAAFAALSARVGSIEDNRLGGWHAYRASKAALNMLLRTLSIELARRNREALCIGLHPGTVDTALSKPFQRNVPERQLVPPAHAAERLLKVVDRLGPEDNGGLFDWDGARIPY